MREAVPGGGRGEQRVVPAALDHLEQPPAQLGKGLRAGRGQRSAGGELVHGSDDRVVRVEHGVDLIQSEAERPCHDRSRERAGVGAPKLAAPRRLERIEQALGLTRDERREALTDRAHPERRRKRGPVTGVLVAVTGEHARADDAPGREPRIVDRERVGVAHRGQHEVMACDQPAVEGGQPRDRLVGAQAREQRVRVLGQLLERRPGADRVLVGRGHSCPVRHIRFHRGTPVGASWCT